MNNRLWLALPVALTLAPCSPSLLAAHADAPLQQAGVEADSDGDGIPDSKDRYPLIADFSLLTWEIHALRFGWSVATETRVQEQTSLTWTIGESEVKIEGDKSKVDISAGGEIAAEVKGGLSSNPLRAFGLFDASASMEARAKAGLSFSKEMEWGSRRQQETRRVAESFAKISRETRVSDPFLSVWITFRNHSSEDLVLRPSGLPVFASGQPVCSASVVERDGPDGLLLPANRPDGVEVEFRAPLDNTTARQLLSGLGEGAPSVDLAKSRCVIRKANGSGDAISAAKRIEDRTVEISVAAGDVRWSWRVAASDTTTLRPVTIGTAMRAINQRLSQEFGKAAGGLFSLEASKLNAIASAPIRSNDGIWVATEGGRDVGRLDDLSPDQPVRVGQPIAFEFKSKAELQEERYLSAKAQVDSGAEKDMAAAVAVLHELAEQGYARAQLAYGYSFVTGSGVAKDEAEAFRWFRKAAEQGVAVAQSYLGVMYADGRGVAKDEAEAVRWYRKASEQGLANAQLYLSRMYETGRGVAKDEAEAVRWCRKAAEQGDMRAQLYLGVMYDKGRGVAKDEAKAVEWYRKAAEQGEANAQDNLGVMYADGRGVAKDEAEAVRWYRKAAEQGYAHAQYHLAIWYFAGVGVAKDDSKAVEWYRKAAEQGHAKAQFDLGRMYATGKGVTKDLIAACAWLSNSASAGEDDAAQTLRRLRPTMSPSEIAAAEKLAGELKSKFPVAGTHGAR